MLDSLAWIFCLEEVLGGRGWQRRAGVELCPWAQGWAHRGGSGQEGAGAGDRVSEDKELHPGDGQGSQGRAGSCSCTEWAAWVGASPQTVNSSKANKGNTSFEGQKEFMASGQTQQIFLARRGRVLNRHFSKIKFLFCISPDEKLSVPSPVRRS